MGGYSVRAIPRPGRGHIQMHRVILERMVFPDLEECDHVNRAGLDNRRCNLRSVTRRQNCHNRGKRNDNTSGYIGVHWHTQSKQWHTYITVNGKRKYLGRFDDKREAARVYNLAARMYRGEFSVLNRI